MKKDKIMKSGKNNTGFKIEWRDLLICSLLCAFFLIILFSVILFIRVFTPQSVSEDITDWGNYSMCVGALFTFVSLVLVYFTYREQSEAYRKQSEVNQQQLDKIQQQFELSQKEAQISNKMFFDSTFFNLLNVQRQIHLECVSDKYNEKGWENGVFCKIKENIKKQYQKWKHTYTVADDVKNIIIEIYETSTDFSMKTSPNEIPSRYVENDIMYYFRNLYQIICHVHRSFLDEEEKKKYINIIQAQMSDEELLVMLFNVIHYTSKNGNKDYLKILDDYGFFENLRSPYDDRDMQDIVFPIKLLFNNTTFKHIDKGDES